MISSLSVPILSRVSMDGACSLKCLPVIVLLFSCILLSYPWENMIFKIKCHGVKHFSLYSSFLTKGNYTKRNREALCSWKSGQPLKCWGIRQAVIELVEGDFFSKVV